ncbi:MAG: Rrf2 family transcriptional regulator [Phycisphaeraceae bacterium]
MLSQTEEYALRAVVWLAGHSHPPKPARAAREHRTDASATGSTAAPRSAVAGPGQTPPTHFTAQQIAQGTGIPAGYLAKVLQALVKTGLVCSRRGLHGGFHLAQAPAQFSVLDVVQAVHPVRHNGNGHNPREPRDAHRAQAILGQALASFTIDRLAQQIRE